MKKTFVWGGKSKLRILIPYLRKVGRKPDYVFDPFINEINFKFEGYHIKKISEIKKYIEFCDSFIVAIGGEFGRERDEIAKSLKEEYGLKPLSLIHDKSYKCDTVDFGESLIMMPGSIINSYTIIGNNCIINTNASIDHECKIGDGVHVMGGAVVTGRVYIDNFSTIGSNATILPDLKIGKGAIIGAGSVVTKDVKDKEVVIGNPAKPLFKN